MHGRGKRADHLNTKNTINFGLSHDKIETRHLHEDKKISLDDLIPLLIKILRRHGGRAHKAEVEREIYAKLKHVFDAPWYQEILSGGVARWQYDITLAKEVAKSKGLIKRPEYSKQGYWELNEKVK